MSVDGSRLSVPEAGVIGVGKGYGRGSGLSSNPNAVVLWDREVFLNPTMSSLGEQMIVLLAVMSGLSFMVNLVMEKGLDQLNLVFTVGGSDDPVGGINCQVRVADHHEDLDQIARSVVDGSGRKSFRVPRVSGSSGLSYVGRSRNPTLSMVNARIQSDTEGHLLGQVSSVSQIFVVNPLLGEFLSISHVRNTSSGSHGSLGVLQVTMADVSHVQALIQTEAVSVVSQSMGEALRSSGQNGGVTVGVSDLETQRLDLGIFLGFPPMGLEKANFVMS
ncbi:hypothetical protein NE237_026820 [Protea cynaroides]|uniref:Uncharacterized protein n=1 Tax=Protea cynaroides TaxID=273540 RepID=A0A9Q0GNZ5_9MAGN|nr:hypothetical protein NE237_026820 [Protea cynaroides]